MNHKQKKKEIKTQTETKTTLNWMNWNNTDLYRCTVRIDFIEYIGISNLGQLFCEMFYIKYTLDK